MFPSTRTASLQHDGAKMGLTTGPLTDVACVQLKVGAYNALPFLRNRATTLPLMEEGITASERLELASWRGGGVSN